MKLNLFETHDRLKHLKKDQSNTIQQGCDDCLKKNPLSLQLQDKSPYIYIYAHPRTADDGVTKRMLWQPRLTKPYSDENSYLFRVQSKTDILEICWMIPPRELWPQYKTGNVTENEIVNWSIDQFVNNKEALDRPHPEDLHDDKIKAIMRDIYYSTKQDKMMKNLYEFKG